jgi:hypothetical protein
MEAETKQQGSIDLGLQNLQISLNEIGELQDSLTYRLERVLTPPNVTSASGLVGGASTTPVQSGIAQHLIDMNYQAQRILSNFRDIASRLEL